MGCKELDTAYQLNKTSNGETHCKQRQKTHRVFTSSVMDAGPKSLMHEKLLLTKGSVTYWKMGTDINKQFLKEKNANVSLNVYKGVRAWSCERKVN